MQIFTANGRAAGSPWYRYGVLLPGYTVLAVSVAVMAAWIVDAGMFTRIVSDFGETTPTGAFGFLFLAIALLFLDSSRWQVRALSRTCAFCAVLLGTAEGVGYWARMGSGFDQPWFARLSSTRHLYLGHMAPVIALSLILMGAAILLLDRRWGRFSISSLLIWITAGFSFLTLIGYVYSSGTPHQLRIFFQVSPYTSLTFLLLCTAIMFARPERGVAAILLRSDLGGEMARRLLPAAIFIPFTVSLLILRMYQAGTYGSVLMVFLFVLAPVMIFVPLVLFGATLLSRTERERKRSEEQLRISTQRFASVVESAMDAIITLDQDQRVIVFNQSAEKMFGCSSWDALGKPLDRFLPAEFRKSHHSHVRNFGESGVTTRSVTSPGILTALRANGEQFPIEATVSQVQVAGQKLYTVILRDITKRKRDEEILRQSEARFRSIYEQAAVGIQQISLAGHLLMVNAAMCRMLGYEENELLGKRIEEITHHDDYLREFDLVASMQREHRRSFEMEKRYRHHDGSLVWAHVTSSLVNGPDGDPLYRISVIQDLTERKRAEEQVKQSQRMEAIGRLAGGVAHDFNTLLNVMLGYSEILLGELAPGDPRRERVLQIKNSGEAGAMLTKQLLAFSRKQAIAQEILDLRKVVSEMTPILGRLLRDDVELTVKCSEEACPVKVDPGQIQQLVLNLAANAGDAMPDGGHLDIEVKAVELDETNVRQHPSLKVGRYATLAISDTGTGMDSETAAHIFEPFFTTKESGKGTGLGLATVYGIAKRSGGDIWVYSELGVGTTIKVYLPLSAEPLHKTEPAVLKVTGEHGGGETILLVEDSPALRELTKVILLRDGYNILEAEDGIAALEVSRSYPGVIDLVLTDVVMPRMRGPNLARQIVKHRPDIAVVFLSGYTEEVISQLDGIEGFTLVEKPYSADVLLHSIRRVLDEGASPERSKV
ncbi:MAG: PAS domain S-box protein [Candidatus Korobacteraceae bacterium]